MPFLLDNKGQGKVSLETLNWGNYDLVVIDESHNFRNNTSRKDGMTRYSRLIVHIKIEQQVFPVHVKRP